MATGPPVLPKWLFYLRIAIIVLSLGCLIAGAVNVSAFDSWGWSASSGPGGFLIFDAIFTWIILGTMLVFELWYHQFYLRLAYVVLLPLAAIFWLSAWAWAASVASVFRGSYNSFWGSDDLNRYSSSIAACAALGAFTWVAVIVLTIFFIIACLRDVTDTVHQTEMGMHAKPETTSAPAPAPAAAPATGFNQQTQDYYGAQSQPHHEVQPQQPVYTQEMPSPDQYQQQPQGTPYPAENTTPYPTEQLQKQ